MVLATTMRQTIILLVCFFRGSSLIFSTFPQSCCQSRDVSRRWSWGHRSAKQRWYGYDQRGGDPYAAWIFQVAAGIMFQRLSSWIMVSRFGGVKW
jgi:hypothetical protein